MIRGIALLSFVVLFFNSCTPNKPQGIYDHGRIEYKIIYLNAEDGNFDPSLLPKKMNLEFNQSYCSNTIDGFMGFFRLGNYTDFGTKKNVTHLKVIDKHYIFRGDKNELMCCFDLFQDMEIELDTNTKVIAGLLSKHAIATIPNLNYSFDIYYTYDIELKHPNVTNPYIDIDGVLTDFELFMGPYRMRFIAKKFYPAQPQDLQSNIPGEAVEVSRQEMVSALNRLMEQ